MSYTTEWEVPDGLWEKMERILPQEKPAGCPGRPALPNRQVVNGILFVLRSGCQWKGLKKEWYGASSSLHERFQRWNKAGLWKKIYRVMVKYYHKKRHIQWRWQAVDSKMVPAPLGGDETGPNPTDRAKSGSKRHLWVDPTGSTIIHLHNFCQCPRCHCHPEFAQPTDCAQTENQIQSSSFVCRQSL